MLCEITCTITYVPASKAKIRSLSFFEAPPCHICNKPYKFRHGSLHGSSDRSPYNEQKTMDPAFLQLPHSCYISFSSTHPAIYLSIHHTPYPAPPFIIHFPLSPNSMPYQNLRAITQPCDLIHPCTTTLFSNKTSKSSNATSPLSYCLQSVFPLLFIQLIQHKSPTQKSPTSHKKPAVYEKNKGINKR